MIEYSRKEFFFTNFVVKIKKNCEECGRCLARDGVQGLCDECFLSGFYQEKKELRGMIRGEFSDVSDETINHELAGDAGRLISEFLQRLQEQLEVRHAEVSGKVRRYVPIEQRRNNIEYNQNRAFFSVDNREKYYDGLVAGLVYSLIFAKEKYDIDMFCDVWSEMIPESIYHMCNDFRIVVALVARYPMVIVPEWIHPFLASLLYHYVVPLHTATVEEVYQQLSVVVKEAGAPEQNYAEVMERVINDYQGLSVVNENCELKGAAAVIFQAANVVFERMATPGIPFVGEIVVSPKTYAEFYPVVSYTAVENVKVYIRPSNAPLAYDYVREERNELLPPEYEYEYDHYTYLSYLRDMLFAEVGPLCRAYRKQINLSVVFDKMDCFSNANYVLFDGSNPDYRVISTTLGTTGDSFPSLGDRFRTCMLTPGVLWIDNQYGTCGCVRTKFPDQYCLNHVHILPSINWVWQIRDKKLGVIKNRDGLIMNPIGNDVCTRIEGRLRRGVAIPRQLVMVASDVARSRTAWLRNKISGSTRVGLSFIGSVKDEQVIRDTWDGWMLARNSDLLDSPFYREGLARSLNESLRQGVQFSPYD